MNISTKTIITAGAVFAAVNGMAWGAWRIGDTLEIRPVILKEFRTNIKLAMDQTQQNSLAIVKNEFSYLQDKLKFGELTFEEKQARCKDAQILGYTQVDGCSGKTGEPDFTTQSTAQ